MPIFPRLVAQLHQIEADSPAQADEIARIRAQAANTALKPLGHATAWAPMVSDGASGGDELMDILSDCYVRDEVDDDPERNPRMGYVDVGETVVPERLMAWRDAAVKAAPRVSQRWLLTAVGESMTCEGAFEDATLLAERSWIAYRGEDEGDLVWLRRESGSWSLLHQEGDGSLVDTKIKVRAR